MQKTGLSLIFVLLSTLPVFGQAVRETHGADKPEAAPHEYKLPGGGDDTVRVFYLKHADTPEQLQEIVTLVRSIADVRRMFTYNALRAFAARGTADQLALVSWLVEQLDQPAKFSAPPRPPHAPEARPHPPAQ